HVAGGAHEPDQRLGRDPADGDEAGADDHGQPHRLDGLVGGLPVVAGAEPPADRGGRAVGQEDEGVVEGPQDARRHGPAAEVGRLTAGRQSSGRAARPGPRSRSPVVAAVRGAGAREGRGSGGDGGSAPRWAGWERRAAWTYARPMAERPASETPSETPLTIK